MPNAVQSEAAQIERFLAVRGWKRGDARSAAEAAGVTIYMRPDGEFWVEIGLHIWSLYQRDELKPRYLLAYEGETLAELEREAVSLGAVAWWCPNCGEEGGEPREAYDRYLYGADADGNRGEWREDTIEGCSKCIVGGRMVR